MSTNQYVLVSSPISTPNEKDWRGIKTENLAKVPIKVLSENIQGFVNSISKTLEKIDLQISSFEIKEVEVYAAITTSGELSLIGVGGGELGIEGGIKFVFAKKEIQRKTSTKKKTKARNK